MFYLTISVFLILSYSTALNIQEDIIYEFEPASRYIEINEGGSYSIYFKETNKTKFNYCYYHSTWSSRSYFINNTKTVSDAAINITDGRFETFSTICGFTLDEIVVNDTLDWTITAHDEITNENYTETVSVLVYYNIPLFSDKINVLENASFMQYIKGEINVKLCLLQYDNNHLIQLDLNSLNATFLNSTEDDNRDLQSRLTSLGQSKCGFKLVKTRLDDPTEWTFIVTDINDIKYRAVNSVSIFNLDEDIVNRTVNVYLGQKVSVNCGKEFANTDSVQNYCHLYNPKGDLVLKDIKCLYEIDLVTIDDIGVWKCTLGYRFIMEALEFRTELIKIEKEAVDVWSEDKSNYYYSIGCKLNNYQITSISYCKITRPDGKIFKIQSGAASERYTTLSTNLSVGVCGLEIVKPLLTAENGWWKCEINGQLSPSNVVGSYLKVGVANDIPYHKRTKKIINLGKSFTIECVVPYSSKHCHITAPNGTRYSTDNIYKTFIGECSLAIEKATVTHTGSWSCTFAKENSPDDVITVEVTIAEMTLLYTDAEVTEGDDADLLCSTSGIPLEHCRFLSPAGVSYYLQEGETKLNRFAYNGAGLKFGDCGIKIRTATAEDSGQWHCYISIKQHGVKENPELSKTISLKMYSSTGFRVAGSIGISVGILLVVVIAAVFAWRKFYKRRSNENVDLSTEYSNPRTSDTSDTGENIRFSQFQSTYRTNN